METMLGKIVVLLVTVPAAWLGTLVDLLEKMTGADGKEWFNNLKLFLRKELVSATNAVATVKEAANAFARLISSGAKIALAATDGTETLAKANDVFYYIDGDFQNWGTNVAGESTSSTFVQVHEMVKDGTFTQIYGGFGENFDKLCLSQAQIKAFCRDHRNWLRTDGYATFFLFKVGTELFVARVLFGGLGRLSARVLRFSLGSVWLAECRLRFVLPQLTLES
jgi:hypothetical protein